MPRGPRRWIKLFCYERLHGSVSYQLSEAEQSVWDKLLCLAGLCGHEGLIADHDLRPYPHSFIIHELHTSENLFEQTLDKCKQEGRISEDGQGIRITNWDKYQCEYERQKPYRERKRLEEKGQGCPIRQCVCGYAGPQQPCPLCKEKISDDRIIKDP